MVTEVYKMQMPTISSKHILLTKFNISAHHDCSFLCTEWKIMGMCTMSLLD